MPERDIQKQILRDCTTPEIRLFRNNVAVAWVGKLISRIFGDGFGLKVTLSNARPLHAGLIVGSGDLIGWKSLIVTPDMVGQRIAIFASIEVKSLKGVMEQKQKDWRASVAAAGGIALVARSVEDAKEGLK